MRTKAVSLVGWFGVIAILAAYAGISLGLIQAHSLWYPLLNLLGAAGILIEAASKKDYQPAVLNLIWLALAIYGLTRAL